MDEAVELTRLLNAAQAGDNAAMDQAFANVYPRLQRISRARRRGWVGAPTLDTALVHEAYLKLAKTRAFRFRSRGHFFATISKAMRHALVNYAEGRRATKRSEPRCEQPT